MPATPCLPWEGLDFFAGAPPQRRAWRPGGAGQDEGQQADFPDHLKAKFGDRRWLAVDPPAFLDDAGAEVVLIGGRDDLGTDLGLDLQPQPEDESRSRRTRAAPRCSKDLHLEKSERAIRPLFGETRE
jgi:hypothetical protein